MGEKKQDSELGQVHNINIITNAYLDNMTHIVNSIYTRFKGHLDRMDVEDIFSAAFLDTCEKIRKGRFDLEESKTSIRAYLYKVCYWQACKKTERKKEFRMPVVTQGDDAGSINEEKLMQLMRIANTDNGNNDVNECDRAECEHAMEVAIGEMNSDCRTILQNHYYDGFNYTQIGDMLHKKASAVKMQAKRCRDSFLKINKHILELCQR